jgi:putative peptide zinc metalloprotease protein
MPIQTQGNSEQQKKILPTLRQDIQILPGPSDPDGSPTFNLYDPIRSSYFKISWAEAIIFENLKPNMVITDLAKTIKKKSTLQVSEEGLQGFLLDAERLGLMSVGRESEEFTKEAEARKSGWLMWIIMHYLYIQIPLFHPDKFLGQTLKYVKPLFSKTALAVYSLILFSGLVLLTSRFFEFLNTFTYFFTPQGIAAFAVGISLVKVIHEFSHAYIAKYFGINVRTMGVALIVFWPVLYTDVTDSWKLKSRLQRFAISFAGIAAELVIASLSTWGWVLTDPGILNSIFFIIASVTWISTLVVNLNPSMRFDGYYLLCDLWGVDNLQWRAFAHTRWFYRKWLLGIDMPMPEPVSPKREAGFLIYSLVTWVWRLSLYLFVAVFVYYKFTKTLGILLFLLEIGIFIFWPLISEVQQVWKIKELFTLNKRVMTTLGIIALTILMFSIPYSHELQFASVTVPRDEQIVYTPYPGVVSKIYVKRDQSVLKGDPIITLNNKEVENKLKVLDTEIEIKNREIRYAQIERLERANLFSKQAELKTLESERKALDVMQNRMTVYSNLDGIVYFLDDQVIVGQTLNKDYPFAKISPLNAASVIAFVPESDLNLIEQGQEVSFYSKDYNYKYEGRIRSIGTSSETYLNFPQLSSVHHGDLPVKEEGDKLILVESFYPVVVDVSAKPPFKIGLTGYIEVKGKPRSSLSKFYQHFKSIFFRESAL